MKKRRALNPGVYVLFVGSFPCQTWFPVPRVAAQSWTWRLDFDGAFFGGKNPPGNEKTYPTTTGSLENHRLKSALVGDML